jgi:hypothetical protein
LIIVALGEATGSEWNSVMRLGVMDLSLEGFGREGGRGGAGGGIRAVGTGGVEAAGTGGGGGSRAFDDYNKTLLVSPLALW